MIDDQLQVIKIKNKTKLKTKLQADLTKKEK